MAEQIVIPGKFNIYLAQPALYGTLAKLGENIDDLNIAMETIKSPVYGDSNGGRAGDPIEWQFLGNRARFSLELTRWDKTVAATLLTHGGLLGTAGTVPQTAMGALMLRDHSYRICFIPTTDATRAKNFPCVMVESNHLLGGGTKHEALRLELVAYKAPEGHLGEKDGTLWDADVTGVPA